jgi:site-specific DNA-methyltransferase (adenine-specific)
MTDAFTLHHGDCLDVLRGMPDASVDAVVTDPPYGLSFMGKRWDYDVPSVAIWSECLRVLKPGGHLLSFGGSRTYHRMAVNVEDAGFEIRDQVMWVYGSGFPKSHNVSKAIDKMAGAEREVVGQVDVGPDITGDNYGRSAPGHRKVADITAPATPAAKQWDGWGSALKPAHEPVVLARKPLGEKTLAANVLKHGTGAINVDGCRVGGDGGCAGATFGEGKEIYGNGLNGEFAKPVPGLGRFPANLIRDGSDEVVELFPGAGEKSAARFFYCAKASKRDRDEGNKHPTVKPTDLMAYLIRLVTPPGGVVLDPFAGSGSTGKAAIREGFQFIGIEREAEYIAIARARIEAAHV